MSPSSSISDFYSEKSIFITGVTGFMGKVLVEKLLRSCGNIKAIYVLLRKKKDENFRQRLEGIINTRVFDKIKEEKPELLKKLVPIQGDLTLPGLGISEADAETLFSKVSIVFHSGATVKFDEPLKTSVDVNVLGTRRVLEFCHKIHNLKALIHLSTAYSNCDRDDIEEVIYPSTVSPQKVIETVGWMDDETVCSITPWLIKKKPNAYTYTKALAETLLVEEGGDLPVAIVRPSIVTAAWKEPLPGWVDNLNGPTGIIVASLKGIFSSMHCDRSCVSDLIPVDIVINLVIAAAWYTATERPNEIKIYNCTSGNLNQLTWGKLSDIGFPIIEQNPSVHVLGYPRGALRDSRMHNWYYILFHHLMPAYLLDMAALIVGKKPRLVNIYKKLHKAEDTLHFFTTRQWSFHSNNVVALYEHLSEIDKEMYNFDVRKLDWTQYIHNYILGARQFVLRDNLSTIPLARKGIHKIFVYTRLIQLISAFAIWRIIMSKSLVARQLSSLFMTLIARLIRLLPFFS